MENDEIISIIRKINPNKTTGPGGISGKMFMLCEESVILPLQIIFTNILSTSIYSDLWKLANVAPIFKKCKVEKIIFNSLYTYLHMNNIINNNQSGFRPGDSTTNQRLYLLDEINQAFGSTKSFEVRTVFLDQSRDLFR